MTVERIALITGGAQGIGAEVARVLAKDGLTAAVADLDAAKASRLVESLGPKHGAFAVDVSDEASVVRLFDEIERKLGKVSVLVHCAGMRIVNSDGSRQATAETSLDEWNRTMAVNVTGGFLTAREFIRRLPADVEHGRIVTVSSIAGQVGGIQSGVSYTTSKAAILGLTKSLARELAPRRITVNCVAPGMIDTAMLRQTNDPKNDEHFAQTIPLRYIGMPNDVAATVSFLVSPGGRYMTGATLDVNGGLRMQ